MSIYVLGSMILCAIMKSIMDPRPLILIVDDEPDFLEIFSLKLEAAGYTILTAGSGAEAIEKAKQYKPKLILMDVQMPEMSGIETMLKLKTMPETSDVRVVFLTSLGEPKLELQGADRLYAREIGALGYLRKTDDLSSLLEHVRTYIG